MAGFNAIESDVHGSVMYADNASFDGTARGGIMVNNGELWIGANAAPFVRKNTLTAGSGVSITNAAGSITIAVNGAAVGQTITGNTGGALSPTAGNWNILTANTTVKFAGSVSTLTEDFGITNLLLGVGGTTITSGIQNVGLGLQSLAAVTSGSANVGIGVFALSSMQTGTFNTAVGTNALKLATSISNTAVGGSCLTALVGGQGNTAIGLTAAAALTSGSSNVAVGLNALNGCLTGSNNIAIGVGAGNTYTGAESGNVIIGVQAGGLGVAGESNVVRLGDTTIVNTYLQGIINMPKGQVVHVTTPGAYPYTTLASDYVVLVDSSSARTINLVSSPVTGQTFRIKDNVGSAGTNNITISPAAGNIDGSASFVINTNYGSVDLTYNGTQWNIL